MEGDQSISPTDVSLPLSPSPPSGLGVGAGGEREREKEKFGEYCCEQDKSELERVELDQEAGSDRGPTEGGSPCPDPSLAQSPENYKQDGKSLGRWETGITHRAGRREGAPTALLRVPRAGGARRGWPSVRGCPAPLLWWRL